jgi:hypothetical protein
MTRTSMIRSTSETDEIRRLLNLAHQHVATARECRAAAGRLLGEARASMPEIDYQGLVADLALDDRSINLLLELAAGGVVRS